MPHLRHVGVIAFALLMLTWPVVAQPASTAFVASFNTVMTIASTVPKNGDVNPYGLVVVPASVGRLVAGDALVSNFNNHRNLQGTGSTIVQIAPSGSVSLWLLLDSRVVNVPMSYHPIFVTPTSWNTFFFNGLTNGLPFSDAAGVEDPGIQ